MLNTSFYKNVHVRIVQTKQLNPICHLIPPMYPIDKPSQNGHFEAKFGDFESPIFVFIVEPFS